MVGLRLYLTPADIYKKCADECGVQVSKSTLDSVFHYTLKQITVYTATINCESVIATRL